MSPSLLGRAGLAGQFVDAASARPTAMATSPEKRAVTAVHPVDAFFIDPLLTRPR